METVEQHNARQLVDEIVDRLEVIRHESDQIAGLLSDLCIYLPHHPIDQAAEMRIAALMSGNIVV